MLKYIVRRALYMIPTVMGVIVVTFILFNVAGGDPAVMRLGKQATAPSLHEYDLQRGYDKPLFAGNWGTTRAHGKSSFDINPGVWSGVEGMEYRREHGGYIALAESGRYEVPLAMPLEPGLTYRWKLRYRLRADAPGEPAPAARLLVVSDESVIHEESIAPTERWNTARLSFESGERPPDCVFAVDMGILEIASIQLNKRSAHFFDSQFVFYLRQILGFDMGISSETNQRIATMILGGIGPSLALTVPMFVAGVLLSVTLALVCAFFRDRLVDRALVIGAVVLMSVNYLVWIVGGQYLLSYKLGWFPIWGFESAGYLFLPWVIGVISGLGWNLRFYRTIMLEEMHKDYVRTAFAKGVGRRGVLFKHVLKNAMIPILTSVVMAIPFLYTGSLLLESFFGIPGLGSISVNALNSSDFDVIKAVVLVGSIIYVIANLLTDISYALVDPRVRLK